MYTVTISVCGLPFLQPQNPAQPQSGSNYYVHQDPITKSQRITDSSGNVVEAIELDPFGGETNRSTNQNYQSHRYTTWERDWTGDESLFRRYHGWWSRFAHPDPYDGSYDSTNPQSFNRYAYVQNDPVNSTDPTGLYAACIHEAMTRFLDRLTGHSRREANALAGFAGSKPGGADSEGYAATNWWNILQAQFGTGPTTTIHFPDDATLRGAIGAFSGYLAQGRQGRSAGYQQAAFVLHAIQDGHGAHLGFGPRVGHGPDSALKWLLGQPDVDHIIGDDKFLRAANETYKVLGGSGSLSPQDVRNLIRAILKGCGKNSGIQVVQPSRRRFDHGGGPGGGSIGSGGGYPGWWYSMWGFADWVNSIGFGEWNNEGFVGPRPTTPPQLKPPRGH